jgi:hypothetical protein
MTELQLQEIRLDWQFAAIVGPDALSCRGYEYDGWYTKTYGDLLIQINVSFKNLAISAITYNWFYDFDMFANALRARGEVR